MSNAEDEQSLLLESNLAEISLGKPGELLAQEKGRARWDGVEKIAKKVVLGIIVLGIAGPLLTACGEDSIANKLPLAPIPGSVNKTAVAATQEALPHGGPIVIYPDASFTPKPQETATPLPTPDIKHTQPADTKIVVLTEKTTPALKTTFV
ncbi:MAG: hypothetical protein Q7K26_03610, partial [bacterium]|nr:hypothetical protein [bacterium]